MAAAPSGGAVRKKNVIGAFYIVDVIVIFATFGVNPKFVEFGKSRKTEEKPCKMAWLPDEAANREERRISRIFCRFAPANRATPHKP